MTKGSRIRASYRPAPGPVERQSVARRSDPSDGPLSGAFLPWHDCEQRRFVEQEARGPASGDKTARYIGQRRRGHVCLTVSRGGSTDAAGPCFAWPYPADVPGTFGTGGRAAAPTDLRGAARGSAPRRATGPGAHSQFAYNPASASTIASSTIASSTIALSSIAIRGASRAGRSR
jgi:hypothetical protein